METSKKENQIKFKPVLRDGGSGRVKMEEKTTTCH
jgi:hypothetical protein